MKIILTEEQYKILEDIINEGWANGNFTDTIEVGSNIKVVMDDGFDEDFKVTNLLDNNKFIEVNDGKDSHIITLDAAINKDNNTFTTINGAKYKPGNKGKASQIIIGGGKQIPLTNVKRVEVYSPNGKLVDTAYTSLGEKDSENSDGDREENLLKKLEKDKINQKNKDKRERDIYNMVLNDPQLKRAFYHQPTLFGGLLNFGKAKGIGPAKDLIAKYIKRFDAKKDEKVVGDFKEFKINHGVRFEILNKPIVLSSEGKELRLDVGATYQARYTKIQYLQGSTGKGTNDTKVGYKIYLAEKVGEDIYKGTIKGFFKERGGDKIVDKMDNVIIKIRDYNY